MNRFFPIKHLKIIIIFFAIVILFLGINILSDHAFAELYWDWLGGPIARLTGWISDSIPFAISELLIFAGFFSILRYLFHFRFPLFGKRQYIYLSSVLILITMSFSQGITPIDWVPSAHRIRPSSLIINSEITREAMDNFLASEHQALLDNFNYKAYSEISEEEILKLANQSMKKILKTYNYGQGREVKNIKSMWGLSRLMGLSYGGPAYHDVVCAEIVIIRYEDMPTARYWRLICIVHELAHAQGFTREMDAEVLTWLCLRESKHPVLKSLSYLMTVIKSGQKLSIPPLLLEEIKREQKHLKDVQSNQSIINLAKSISKSMRIQNSGEKYGTVEQGQKIPLNHEFFASILGHSQNK